MSRKTIAFIVVSILVFGGLFFVLVINQNSSSGPDSGVGKKENVENQNNEKPSGGGGADGDVSPGNKQVDGERKNSSAGFLEYESFQDVLNKQVDRGRITREEADNMLRETEEKRADFESVLRSAVESSENLKENLMQP